MVSNFTSNLLFKQRFYQQASQKVQMQLTDYHGIHEPVYRRKREAGESGWSSCDAIREMKVFVQTAISRHGIVTGKLLELGCGDGGLSLALHEVGFDIYGIDIVPMAIEWAAEKAKTANITAHFQTGSVTSLPYDDDSFDLVLDADCSHCIIGKDRVKFFEEARRVTKPSGHFISSCLCGDPRQNLMKFFDRQTRCLVRNGISGRYYGRPENILSEAEDAGLTVLESHLANSGGEQQELIMVCRKSLNHDNS